MGLAGTAVTCYWGALQHGGGSCWGRSPIASACTVLLGFSTATMALGGLTFVFAPWTWLAMVGMALLGFPWHPSSPD